MYGVLGFSAALSFCKPEGVCVGEQPARRVAGKAGRSGAREAETAAFTGGGECVESMGWGPQHAPVALKRAVSEKGQSRGHMPRHRVTWTPAEGSTGTYLIALG